MRKSVTINSKKIVEKKIEVNFAFKTEKPQREDKKKPNNLFHFKTAIKNQSFFLFQIFSLLVMME